MGRHASVVLYVLALVVVVVSVDVLFFRNRLWERLMVNVGIVLVFWAFYLRFLKPPDLGPEPGQPNRKKRIEIAAKTQRTNRQM